jgi:hypothetical protein
MKIEAANPIKASVPLSLALPGFPGTFAGESRVIFQQGEAAKVQFRNFLFEEGVLKSIASPVLRKKEVPSHFSDAFPVFSLIAIVLMILFRNLFNQPFMKYFLNFRLNYEVDLNLQKIGLPSLFMAFMVIFFAFFDYIRLTDFPGALNGSIKSVQVLVYPMACSILVHFFLSLSARFFPLLLPDLKVFFLLSVLLLLYNFSGFSNAFHFPVSPTELAILLSTIFLTARSIYYFGVFRKFFRYRRTLSLFYICTLNLVTCLVMHRVFF